MTNPAKKFKSGYAGIIGKPNVGKSTLLNRLVRQKIAAMSPKPQTTRNKIIGVMHKPEGQIILVDTPGIHQSDSRLNKLMVKASLSAYRDVDLILFMIDAKRGFDDEDEYVFRSMRDLKTEKILIINKIDLVRKPQLLTLMHTMDQKQAFADIVPISALNQDGLDLLVELILNRLQEGPRYFPEDMVTDCPEKFLVGEIVREKAMTLTHFEVPYSIAVVVDSLEENERGVVVIHATIFAEKTSQKKILVGEKGAMLKKVGELARKEMEKRFATKVYLSLFVKVKKGWRENERTIKGFGYTHDSY